MMSRSAADRIYMKAWDDAAMLPSKKMQGNRTHSWDSDGSKAM